MWVIKKKGWGEGEREGGAQILEPEGKQPPCQTFANLPVLVKLCFEKMFEDNSKGNNEMIWQGRVRLEKTSTSCFLDPGLSQACQEIAIYQRPINRLGTSE